MRKYFMIHSMDPSVLTQRVLEGAFARAAARECPVLVESAVGFQLNLERLSDCGGLMTQVWYPREADPARLLPFPVVNFSNTAGEWSGMGNVLSDDEAVGRLVAEHMLKRGYRAFLGIGNTGRVFSAERLTGFAKAIAACGEKLVQLEVTGEIPQTAWSPGRYLDAMWEQLGPTIGALPLEAGIFAVNDWVGWPVLRLLEEKAPERLYTTCLVGADNMHDALFDPRKAAGLSSVVPGFRQIGREGLDILMDHQDDKAAVARIRRRCPPEGIVERASSAGPACADPITAKVMRQMWTQLRTGQPVVMADLARRQGMTSRTLERKFSQFLGRSAREWLAGMRIDYAKELLRDPALPVGEIALRCGFADAPAFSSAFRKSTGASPREWRAGKPQERQAP